jgi:hypothetical protein
VLAFALLGWKDAAVCDKLARECAKRDLSKFTSQEVCNLMWSFSCVDVLRVEGVRDLFLLQQPVKITDRSLKDARQLFQARLAWTQAHPGVASPLLDSLCAGGWVDSMVAKDESPTSSRSHLRISNLLKPYFGPSELQDEACLLGGIWVDMLFPVLNVVVEMDGPTHYLSDGDLDGKTLFKRRLLKGAGYKVTNIKIQTFGDKSLDEQNKFASALAEKIKGSK